VEGEEPEARAVDFNAFEKNAVGEKVVLCLVKGENVTE
jgi:hypothetical protein